MTDLLVRANGTALWQNKVLRCAIGRSGMIAAEQKHEGDGATPMGAWPMRRLYYRADQLALPVTALPIQSLAPQDGWCDAPDDACYNQFVQHPYPARAEHLWRDDAVYDLIVTLGYNDTPVIAEKGSAIFLHLAQPDFRPTAGCVALSLPDLLMVLQSATQHSRVVVQSLD